MAQSPRRNPTAATASAPPDGAKESPRAAQPFLKWVGGKSQLLDRLDPLFPAEITRYVEPFVGGGAVFFHLQHRFPAMTARLRDRNPELINAYRVVRDEPEALMQRLDEHLVAFLPNRKRYYYRVRSPAELPADDVARAARMIFLNKTCFNGLWRVNGSGAFNVPLGWQARPRLYSRPNVLAASAALQGADLAVQDFRATFDEMEPGEVAYIDPPYVPMSTTARFTSYTKEDFGATEQVELAARFAAAAGRGVRLVLSNSDTTVVRDLYRDFTIHPVAARRAINRDATKRGLVGEVVVIAGQ